MEVLKETWKDYKLDLDHRKGLLIKDIEAGNISLSYSSIVSFMKSPKTFIDYKLKERKTTDAMIFGNLVHCLILQPEEFDNQFSVKDFNIPGSDNQKNFAFDMSQGVDCDTAYMSHYKLTKKELETGIGSKGKDLEAKLEKYINYLIKEADPKNKTQFVTYDKIEEAKKYKELAYSNRASKYVLDQITDTEIPISWEYAGYKWRGYMDGVGSCYADLKMMAQSAKPKKARWKITDMGYHLQGALYVDGSGMGNMPYYVIGMDNTFNISVTELTDSVLDKGREAIEHIMTNFNMCVLDNRWNESYDFWEQDERGICVMEFND